MDQEAFMSPQAFDVPVLVDFLRPKYQQAFQMSQVTLREVASIDEKIISIIQTISDCRSRRDTFKGYSMDPIEYMNQWTASQTRDLEVRLFI